MVMKKFLEKLVTDDNKELLETLFYDNFGHLFSTTSHVNVIYPNNTPVYSVFSIASRNINESTYDDYNELFMFLKKHKVSFSLNDRQFTVNVVNVNSFIDELKKLSNINKYNL